MLDRVAVVLSSQNETGYFALNNVILKALVNQNNKTDHRIVTPKITLHSELGHIIMLEAWW